MNWKFTFISGFIYGGCSVLFGWLLWRVFNIPWAHGTFYVIVIDLALRNILAMAAKQYLKSVERKYKD